MLEHHVQRGIGVEEPHQEQAGPAGRDDPHIQRQPVVRDLDHIRRQHIQVDAVPRRRDQGIEFLLGAVGEPDLMAIHRLDALL
ncbi:MAG: hypothetical protein P4L90_20245, partial [Rhodopila sp.]|nr:hypothetical protein [Rhodopila sp.]